MMKRLIFGLAALMFSLSTVKESNAVPISVSYTVSGSPGNYDLDFGVTNNMLAWPTQDVYLFGVQLSVSDITGSPANFFNHGADLNWFGYGGTATEYNNNWRDSLIYNDLLPGITLSGFTVHVPNLVAPTAVSWFAVAYGSDPYTGGGNFITAQNPGFEGIANPVPEPSTFVMSMILLGMFGAGWVRTWLHRSGMASTFGTGLNGPRYLAIQPSNVPEPSSIVMLGLGLIGSLTFIRRGKSQAAQPKRITRSARGFVGTLRFPTEVQAKVAARASEALFYACSAMFVICTLAELAAAASIAIPASDNASVIVATGEDFYNDDMLRSYFFPGFGNGSTQIDAWLKFDVSSIPAAATINSVALTTYAAGVFGAPVGTPPLQVFRSAYDGWGRGSAGFPMNSGAAISAVDSGPFPATAYVSHDWSLNVSAMDWTTDLVDHNVTLLIRTLDTTNYNYMYWFGSGGGVADPSGAYAPVLTVDYTPTPEPGSIALAAFGFFGLAAWGWRRLKPSRA